jgi:hypothetical protein
MLLLPIQLLVDISKNFIEVSNNLPVSTPPPPHALLVILEGVIVYYQTFFLD